MKFSPGILSTGGGGGYWDRFINGDDSFHNVINMLDFPLESVEEDKCVVENWEPQFQSLGSFNSEILQGLAPVFKSDIAEDAHDNFVQNVAASDRKQLPVVAEISSTHIPLDSSHPRNPSLFQTPSPNHVLESSSSCSAGKNLSTCPELLVPVGTRTKILRSSTFTRWHLLSPLSSPKKISKRKKKIMKLSQIPNEFELSEDCYHQHMPSKRCMHCQAVKTPQWRDGPMGPKTLCNACGVRYRCGHLLPEYRPIASNGSKSKKFSCSRGKEKKIKLSSEIKDDSTNQLPEDLTYPLPCKRCTQCHDKENPPWKNGPVDPSTLCIACGVRYRSSCHLRETHPLASHGPGRNERTDTRNSEKELPDLPHDSEPVGVASHQHGPAKRCAHCQAVKTPQWRNGPMGPKTLCNACGVRYRSGRLVPEYRPASSPTFVPSLHSNLHRKVIKIREKPIPEIIKCEIDPAMSPPPEIVPMSSYVFNCV